jgi:2',3'-cyclic-nucleotide 2'-phosphodiesterase (5'-nucleotidase family)
VNGSVDPSGVSYRSYGVLKDEMIDFVEESVHKAKAAGAEKIVLCCHYGIAQDLPDPILPESGLGRLENLCREHNIRLFLSGHEHTKGSPVRKYGRLYNVDAAMTAEQYGVVEIYPDCTYLTVYNTSDHSVSRVDRMETGG